MVALFFTPPQSDLAVEIFCCSRYFKIGKVFRYWTAEGEKYLLRHHDNTMKIYLHMHIFTVKS